jgi:hypothetical protein
MDRFDRFAAAALTGLLAARKSPLANYSDVVEDSYTIAAAMIRERRRRDDEDFREEDPARRAASIVAAALETSPAVQSIQGRGNTEPYA